MMQRSSATLAAILILAVGRWDAVVRAAEVAPAVLEAERGRVAIIEKITPAVVAVFQRGGAGGGSGVLITRDGYALTNYHVVGSDQFFKCGLSDRNIYDAVLVGVDPTGDVALIKLIGRDDFPTASWGDSDTVHVGDWVYVLGNPFLLASDLQPTATYGIVSGIHRYQYPANTILEYTDCLQVDASVNPGNSGGPLFNAGGELIGINGRISIAQRGRVNAGAGYAISINQIHNFLGHLRSGRIVDHGTLGATVSTDSHSAVVVSQILDESDAFRRGLHVDDEIISFAGRPIRSVNQFKNVLGIFPEGWKIPLVYRRDGEKHEIRVRLRPLHSKLALRDAPPADDSPPERSPERSPGDPKPKDLRPREKVPRNPLGPSPREPRRPRRTSRNPNRVPEADEKLKGLYVAKSGYANYHFNQLEQTRVLRGLDSWSALRGRPVWFFSGNSAAGAPFECEITSGFSSLETGGKTYLQMADQEPQDEPVGTGGLLVALQQLRLFVTQHDKAFATLSYFGTEPLDGTKEVVDVLTSSLGSVECRWYFSAATGAFAGFDTRLLEDADDCEVRFREIGTFDGVRFPSEIVVRHKGAEYGVLRVLRLKERK